MPTCEGSTLYCQLRRIADDLTGFDWNDFAATLLATLVGAAIALFGAGVIAWYERRERYRTRLHDAVVRGVEAIMFEIESVSKSSNEEMDDAPYRGRAVFLGFGVATMTARGKDEDTLQALHPLLDAYVEARSRAIAISALHSLAEVLVAWSSGWWSSKKAIEYVSRKLDELEVSPPTRF